jgi:hypothetical protein
MDFICEFENYATKHMGITECSSVVEQLQESLYNNVMVSGAQSSLTPYILEEREMRVTQMDFSLD